jgi:hypothetical protein
MRRRNRILYPGLALAAALIVVACGTAPSPSSATPAPLGQAVSATNQRDGVVVTLAASSDRVRAGDRIRLRITALNAGLGPAAYMAGGCGPIGAITVSGGPQVAPRDVGDPPQGADPASVLGLARWSALSQGSPGLDWIRAAGIPDDIAMGCPADLRWEDLDPGESFTDEAVWIARTGDAVPAPPGEYLVELAFPFAGRRTAEEAGAADDRTPPIAVAVLVVVEGGGAPAVDAVAAVDAAVADPDVLAWAGRTLTRERLTGATITYVDGRWRFRIGVSGGGDADIWVDAQTGAVVERPR